MKPGARMRPAQSRRSSATRRSSKNSSSGSKMRPARTHRSSLGAERPAVGLRPVPGPASQLCLHPALCRVPGPHPAQPLVQSPPGSQACTPRSRPEQRAAAQDAAVGELEHRSPRCALPGAHGEPRPNPASPRRLPGAAATRKRAGLGRAT
jgi:hypothetical protein